MMKKFSTFHKAALEKARLEEAALLPSLRCYFDDPELEQSAGAFSTFDFVSPRRKIELKTRNCLVDTYGDLMINSNKIAEARKNSHLYDYIFVFRFKDNSTYYWKFEPHIELDMRLAGRTDRGRDERRDHCFIPNDLLQPLLCI